MTTLVDDHFLLTIRVLQGISVTACLAVVVSFVSFQEMRKASGHLSLWVALGNIISGAAKIMDGEIGTIQCSFSAFGRTFGSLVLITLCGVTAWRIDALFNKGAPPNMSISRKEFVLIWVVPLFISIMPFFTDSYGKQAGGKWCWLKMHHNVEGYYYTFFLYYIPLWLTLAYTIFIYYRLSQRASKMFNARLTFLVNRVKWYPVNMIICNVSVTVERMAGIFFFYENSWLMFCSLFTLSLLGLADSIAYFTNPSVYQLWRNYIRAVSRSFSLNTIHVPNVFSSGETGETEMTHQSTHEDEFEVESSVSVLHQSTLFADKDLVRTDEDSFDSKKIATFGKMSGSSAGASSGTGKTNWSMFSRTTATVSGSSTTETCSSTEASTNSRSTLGSKINSPVDARVKSTGRTTSTSMNINIWNRITAPFGSDTNTTNNTIAQNTSSSVDDSRTSDVFSRESGESINANTDTSGSGNASNVYSDTEPSVAGDDLRQL